MEEQKFESVLKLERLYFENIQYKRDINLPVAPNGYEMNFTREVTESAEEDHFRVGLTANVHSQKDNSVLLTVTIIGDFICQCADKAFKNRLINENAIAVLFPYIRSQITLISTQPDSTPIIIPPVNIVALFRDEEAPKPESD